MKLTIRVGAAVDRSLSEAFRPLVASGEQAKNALERQARQGAAARLSAVKRGRSQEEKEYEKLSREVDGWKRQDVAAHDRAERDKTRATEREITKRKKAEEKAAKEAQAASFGGRLSKAVGDARKADGYSAFARHGGSAVRGAAGFAAGIVGDLARGAGVDLDFGSMVAKNNALESQATDLSNAGYMAGDARNGLRVDPKALMAQSLSVGKATGTDANEVMEGLSKFVAKTGDLAMGRDLLLDMSKLAKSTGASMSDMADMAGDIASNIADGPDKAAKVQQVMSAIAAQGKMGAVEVKQLATQMAKLASASGQFEGDSAKNMIAFGAMAQMSRQKGGAASASQAANTIGAFVATFTKGARLKEFEKYGVKTLGEGNKTRDPKDIILDSIRTANAKQFGGPAKANVNMGDMFKDVNARRAMMGWEATYKEAGGGEKGLKAVSEAYDKYMQSTMDAAEAAASFKAAMGTSQSQAEVFNQALRESALKLQTELTPAVVALAPYVVEAAKAMAEAVSWITGKSAVSGQLKTTEGTVNAVVAASEAGIKAGKVDAGQGALNARAEAEAAKTLEAARAEADKAKGGQMGSGTRKALQAFDMLGVGELAGRALGKGQGLGAAAIQKDQEKVADAQARADAAEALLKLMHEESVKLNTLLASGKVVVKMEGGGAPPGIDPGTRQAPPGQR